MEEHLPIRCRAEEVGWGRMRIELLSLWRVELLLEPDRNATTKEGNWGDVALSLVTWAGAPDGRCWDYGCQRDDWTLGPDSRLVEPLQFLSAGERIELEVLLREARCWPEPIAHQPRAPVMVLEEWVHPRRRRSRRHRRAEIRSSLLGLSG